MGEAKSRRSRLKPQRSKAQVEASARRCRGGSLRRYGPFTIFSRNSNQERDSLVGDRGERSGPWAAGEGTFDFAEGRVLPQRQQRDTPPLFVNVSSKSPAFF